MKEKILFLGIAGTGMAATAGLARQLGYEVIGYDKDIYPPMSDVLRELAIPVAGELTEALLAEDWAGVVVGNRFSRRSPEIDRVVAAGLTLTSFPAFLENRILTSRRNVVVAGTHGKTTTSSWITGALRSLGQEPGYMIGGRPLGMDRGFDLGTGPIFVLEGDEYDTAFFDKRSKFFHYRPEFVALGSCEFDHADIFADLAAVRENFQTFLAGVKDPSFIVVNGDDPQIRRLCDELAITERVLTVSAGGDDSADLYLLPGKTPEERRVATARWGEQTLRGGPPGYHNGINLLLMLGLLDRLEEAGLVPPVAPAQLAATVAEFRGVARRFEVLCHRDGIVLINDFAHHPTAVRHTLATARQLHPQGRLVALFEPKNATSRRNIFAAEWASALQTADRVYVTPVAADGRIPEDGRLDTQQLARRIGTGAAAFESYSQLKESFRNDLRAGDVVVFLSCGALAGLPQEAQGWLMGSEVRTSAGARC